jgi:hypothetical protein
VTKFHSQVLLGYNAAKCKCRKMADDPGLDHHHLHPLLVVGLTALQVVARATPVGPNPCMI